MTFATSIPELDGFKVSRVIGYIYRDIPVFRKFFIFPLKV
jgi:hypothetical protein